MKEEYSLSPKGTMNPRFKIALITILSIIAASVLLFTITGSSHPQYSNEACQAMLVDGDSDSALRSTDADDINLREIAGVYEKHGDFLRLYFAIENSCEPFRI